MNRAKLIQSLFEKYNSDKAGHGYAKFYADHLPESPKKILEIGVREGASILAWKELFPMATIVGLDLFEEFSIPMIEGAHFWKGNQLDYRILAKLRELNFDVVIDDGSHNSRDQLITFFGLFNGKHYFIEDLHTCKDDFWRDGLPFEFTALNVIPALNGMSHISNEKIVVIYANQ
jgi:hypothetical protein